jgi:hypothetical protein
VDGDRAPGSCISRTNGQTVRPLQDEATEAWNPHTALRYKAGRGTRPTIRAGNVCAPYLGSAALVDPALTVGGTHLPLGFDAGLADRIALTHGGQDLDNCLFPLARRSGVGRFHAVVSRKRHAACSTIAVAPATPPRADRAAVPPLLSVRTNVSATSAVWKEAIHQARRAVQPEPVTDEPVRVQLCFRESVKHNWSTPWTPAIDTLGPLLGMPDPDRPFRPSDDRIIDLAQHRNPDDSLRHDLTIAALCSPIESPVAQLGQRS